MKILICLLLTFNVFADKKLELLKQLEEVNKVQQVADIAKSKLDNAEDKTNFQTYIDQFKKNKLEGIAADVMEMLARNGEEEAKCLVKMRSKLDSFSLPYNGSESCAQLKVACEASEDCSGRNQGL